MMIVARNKALSAEYDVLIKEMKRFSAFLENERNKEEPFAQESNTGDAAVSSAQGTIKTFIVGIPRNIALSCIKVYRHAISPLLPPSCRYVPTCSEYALTAFERFGFWRGIWLSVKRVGRCHPFAEGGYDPVPER